MKNYKFIKINIYKSFSLCLRLFTVDLDWLQILQELLILFFNIIQGGNKFPVIFSHYENTEQIIKADKLMQQ